MPSLSHKERKQRKSCVDWLNTSLSLEDPQKRYVFATLTLKQARKHKKSGVYEPLNDEKAEQNAVWFADALNKRVYKNRYKRGEAKLELVDFAEGGEGKLERQHRHMLIELPTHLGFDEFCMLIDKIWKGSRFGYSQYDLQIAAKPSSVIWYGLKTGTEALNLENLSFGYEKKQ